MLVNSKHNAAKVGLLGSAWQAVPPWLGTVGITLAWLTLQRQALHGQIVALTTASLTTQVLIGAVSILLVGLVLWQRRYLGWSAVPRLTLLPVSLMLGSAISAIALSWWIHLDQIPVVLFTLGSYGLLGLFLAPVVWRRGLPMAALVALTLPFGMQFSTGLGFPVRVLTAQIVADLLSPWHLGALSSHDVIVLENGMAQVDLPCSGLKSLWTGTLFLLAATWLEGRRLGWRWLLLCGCNLALLISMNVGRVLALVLLTHGLQLPVLAQLLHIPLGVTGFVIASSVTWGLLRLIPQLDTAVPAPFRGTPLPTPDRLAPWPIQGLLVLILVGLLWIPQPPSLAAASPQLGQLPAIPDLQTQPLRLSATEQAFFADYPGTTAQKQQFQFHDLTGSFLLVASHDWQAHHAPELCFLGNGLRIDHTERLQVTPQFPSRWLALEQGHHTAIYWFQSPQLTTDNVLRRIWQDVAHRDRTWVMASLLFDNPQSSASPVVQALITDLHTAVDRSFQGASL